LGLVTHDKCDKLFFIPDIDIKFLIEVVMSRSIVLCRQYFTVGALLVSGVPYVAVLNLDLCGSSLGRYGIPCASVPMHLQRAYRAVEFMPDII